MPNGGVKVYQLGYEKRAVKPRFIFVLPCRFIFWWRGLLRLAFSDFGFAPEPIAVAPSCWQRAVAFAIHLQDVDMMGEPVEQGAGEPFRAEYGGPFIEWQVAGDQRGAAFIVGCSLYRRAGHRRAALAAHAANERRAGRARPDAPLPGASLALGAALDPRFAVRPARRTDHPAAARHRTLGGANPDTGRLQRGAGLLAEPPSKRGSSNAQSPLRQKLKRLHLADKVEIITTTWNLPDAAQVMLVQDDYVIQTFAAREVPRRRASQSDQAQRRESATAGENAGFRRAVDLAMDQAPAAVFGPFAIR